MNDDDILLPDSKVRRRFGVCGRTLTRWDQNPTLAFPPPIVINNRKYRRLSELQAWERARAAGKSPEAA
jgi:hypothetical protein